MSNNHLYQVLEQKFVRLIEGGEKKDGARIFTGFTYKNSNGKGTVYPVLIRRPEKDGAWCFYAKREKTIEHIPMDEFINRYLSSTVKGVRGRLKNGATTSITFNRKDLLQINPEFSNFLLEIKAAPRPNNQGLDDWSKSTTNPDTQSSVEILIPLNSLSDIDESTRSECDQIFQLKADMVFALDDLDQRKLGEDVDAIVKRRVGQSVFRSLLEAKHGSHCHASLIDNRRLLIASHIVPWSWSTGEEKTDPDNGLLLAVNWDAVFDKGLISFDDQGKAIFSDNLDEKTSDQLGLDRKVRLREGILTLGRKKYLQRHRQDVFECWKKAA